MEAKASFTLSDCICEYVACRLYKLYNKGTELGTNGVEEQDEQTEEVQEEGMEGETEGEVKFKKSPVHEQYQPTQPLVASFILNQVRVYLHEKL